MSARWWVRQPEILAIALAAGAWTWMLWEAWSGRQWSCCHVQASPLGEAAGWLLMVLAMMLPFTVPSLRRMAQKSYRTRRLRTVVFYIAGYLGVWMLPLAAVIPLRQFPLGHETLLATLLCLASAAWALHPLRRRLFLWCHREIPLRPLGWRADQDAFRQGTIQAFPCLGGCLPLMVACAVTHHHLMMMVGGTLLAGMERRMFRFQATPLAASALGLAGWTLLLA